MSALQQPNYFYLNGATEDSIESHAAALRYVDSDPPPLSSSSIAALLESFSNSFSTPATTLRPTRLPTSESSDAPTIRAAEPLSSAHRS